MPHHRRGKRHQHHGGDVCGIVVVGLKDYSYCRNHMGWEFFVPAQTLIGVFLLTA